MNLRSEAMLMLDKRGAVLDTARRISALMRKNDISGAIIGGVAVVLHGHHRTTKDVDVWIRGPLAAFDEQKRKFIADGVLIHLFDSEMVQPSPKRSVVIENVTTVSLADLINIKLRSGTSNIARAQDVADVIGLIRHHKLTNAFATRIEKSLRPEFRKLVCAVRAE